MYEQMDAQTSWAMVVMLLPCVVVSVLVCCAFEHPVLSCHACRFLRAGAGGATPLALPRSSSAGGTSCAPAGNRRPRSNFAGQFAAAHAAEQLAANRMLKEARSTTLQQLGRGVGGEGGNGSSGAKRKGA
jgi:hypothetical protein